jgi:hypothetical protein
MNVEAKKENELEVSMSAGQDIRQKSPVNREERL